MLHLVWQTGCNRIIESALSPILYKYTTNILLMSIKSIDIKDYPKIIFHRVFQRHLAPVNPTIAGFLRTGYLPNASFQSWHVLLIAGFDDSY